MPNLSVLQLKQALKKKEFYPCYFLYGDEKWLINDYAKKIVNCIFGKDISDFDFSVFTQQKYSFDDVYDFLLTFPMMSKYKCAVVNDLNIEKLKKDEQKRLSEIIDILGDNAILIIALKTVDIDTKKASVKKFIKLVNDSGGAVLKFDYLAEKDLAKHVQNFVKKRECTIASRAVYELIQNCPPDLSAVINELSKLCALKIGGEITLEDVKKSVVTNLQASVFVFSRAVIEDRISEALRLLGILLDNKEAPTVILSVLSSSYIDIFRVKSALQYKVDTKEITVAFSGEYKGREFKLKNAQRLSSKYSLEQLNKIIKLLYKTEISLKLTMSDPKIVLQKLIVKLSLVYRGGDVLV